MVVVLVLVVVLLTMVVEAAEEEEEEEYRRNNNAAAVVAQHVLVLPPPLPPNIRLDNDVDIANITLSLSFALFLSSLLFKRQGVFLVSLNQSCVSSAVTN